MHSIDKTSSQSNSLEDNPLMSFSAANLNSSMASSPSTTDVLYYYQYLYPFKLIFNWLSHSYKPSCDIINREFAMSFRSGAYKRYNSFNNIQEFKTQIQKANPDRFEIGAVYNRPPCDRDSVLKTEMKALEKELVFDIDMDDYDHYRTCCSGAQVCDKCWKFISLAIKVINSSLVNDFGFENFIWIFSGRRGAHCWISDKRARIMNDTQRKNVLDYMNVIKDRNMEKRLNLLRPYHPHLSRSLEMLKPYFAEIILNEQNPWQDDNTAIQFLAPAVHDKQLTNALKVYWKENPNRSSEQKWKDIDVIASQQMKILKKQEYVSRLRECKEDLIMATLYPKLDVEVTKQTIHLLKAPFCIHPATGNVCVPINETFTPVKALKLIQLQREMELKDNKVQETSLQPYLDVFNKFVSKVINQELNSIKREREQNDTDQIDVDF